MGVFLNVRPLLKAVYPDMKAPSGFAFSVMEDVRHLNTQVPFVIPAWFGKTLRPVAAIALSAALIFGLFAHDGTDLDVIPAEGGQIYENGNETDEPAILVEPDISGNNQFVQAEPTEPSDEPEMEDISQQTQDTSEPPAIQDPQINLDVTIGNEAVAEATPKQDKPLAFETVAVSPLSPVSSNGNMKVIDDIPESITIGRLDREPVIIAFNEAVIPDPSVFVRRERIIEVESIRLSVQRIDKVFSRIEGRAEFFNVKSDMTVTNIRDDGTIIVMKSFNVPSGLADIFVTHIAAFGKVSERDSSRLDITSEYSQMLDEQSELINEVLKTGNKAQELRGLINDLIFFEQRSKPGTKNVVVWLEDGVDF